MHLENLVHFSYLVPPWLKKMARKNLAHFQPTTHYYYTLFQAVELYEKALKLSQEIGCKVGNLKALNYQCKGSLPSFDICFYLSLSISLYYLLVRSLSLSLSLFLARSISLSLFPSLSISDDKNLTMSNLKAFAEDKIYTCNINDNFCL